MTDNIKALNNILHWKLLKGSHEYPGPDGGTCINEAAIVVAGMPYREVGGVSDLPACFSPVIGIYLLNLNDSMSHRTRQRLIEFAPRLAGSADTDEVERQRADYIAIESVRRIAGMRELLTEAAKRIKTLSDALHVALCMRDSAMRSDLITACNVGRSQTMRANYAGHAAHRAKRNGKSIPVIDNHCIEIARGALAIGKQADPIETDLIVSRVAKAREKVDAAK